MSLFLVIVDGAADRFIAEIGGTPWEVAKTPALDGLVQRGTVGLVDVIPGIAPESDSGCMALLGFDPRKYYTGRGPLEGLGAGFLDGAGHHVCFRCNFASWNPRDGTLNRRTSRNLTQGDLDTLVADLKQLVHLEAPFAVSFDMVAYGAHRGLLSFHSESFELGGAVTNTDPLFANAGPFGVPVGAPRATALLSKPRSPSEADAMTAVLVNQFVSKASAVLEAHPINQERRRLGLPPANLILVRDGGAVPPSMPSFRTTFGRTVSFHGQIPAERGLMRLLGGHYVDARAREHEPDEGFYAKVATSLLADGAEVRAVHLAKAADEAGHDGDPKLKVKSLESFDRLFLGPLLERMGPKDMIIVTSDHATPCALGIHSADPVPTVVAGPDVPRDHVREFGESRVRRGGINGLAGHELMPWALRYFPR